MNPLGCVTGRFQPVHAQHNELFELALSECAHVIIAVTNADPDARRPEPASAHRHTSSANPFTYYERVRLIDATVRDYVAAGRVTLVPFDLARPANWTHYVPLDARHYVRAYGDWERYKALQLEQAGYAVTLLDGTREGMITASEIRARLRAGDPGFRELVPPATVPVLEELLRRVPMAERT